jgi:hypothetical protein
MEILQLLLPADNSSQLNSQLHCSQSHSHFTANQFILMPSPLRPTTRILFFDWTLAVSLYVTAFLMRWWVCHLQLLLALASAVILASESRRTHDHILLSQIQDSPNLEGQVPIYMSPGTGWPTYTRRQCVPFHRLLRHTATVEVFDPTSTQATAM